MSTLYYHPRRGGKATKVKAHRLDVLNAIRARADAATPGPWVWHEGDLLTEDNFSRQHSSMFSSVLHLTDDAQGVNDLVSWEYVRSVEDAEFIAYARTDIPALLAHIDALHALLGNLVDGIDECWASLPDNQLHIDTLENITGKRVKRDS